MGKTCVMLGLSAMLALQLPAAGTAAAQANRMSAWLDYACFDYPPDNGLTLVEFYYSILRHEMTFAHTDSGFTAMAYVLIELVDDDGTATDTLFKRIATIVREAEEIGNRNVKIADQLATTLKPGSYMAVLTVEDAESRIDEAPMTGKTGERRVRVVVPDFPSDRLTVSGVELSYRIEALPIGMKASEERSIDKSSRRIVPNPSRIFVNSDSNLYFYAEVYNLAFGTDLNRKFKVGCQVLDTHGAVVSNYGERSHFKPGTSAIVSSSLDIHDLPEGIYFINLQVTDVETGETATGSKPFQVVAGAMELAPGKAPAALTEGDVTYLEKVLKYHLTIEQKRTLQDLSLDGKMQFFEDFWNRNDPDPSTRLNELKVELFRRFDYANQHFSLSMKKRDDGWQTDRGRVYIVYGEPDEIQNYPWTPDRKPFEKWNYFSIGSQGARFFIFEDKTGYGDYRLAHSNAEGEPFDPEWEKLIERGHLMNY